MIDLIGPVCMPGVPIWVDVALIRCAPLCQFGLLDDSLPSSPGVFCTSGHICGVSLEPDWIDPGVPCWRAKCTVPDLAYTPYYGSQVLITALK